MRKVRIVRTAAPAGGVGAGGFACWTGAATAVPPIVPAKARAIVLAPNSNIMGRSPGETGRLGGRCFRRMARAAGLQHWVTNERDRAVAGTG
ncbi:hypothetical protein [Sphingomonas sp. Ant20]|uniref:hypothetical protein n=1 Tax=Sphingomonas sp. Ant20 TaxID=104605 RepID=UPI00274070DE|nr:hypothetical protein [Sphingomonas sp. Ant20]